MASARYVKQFNISGLNLKDVVAPIGECLVMNNLRPYNGALRNVNKHVVLEEITEDNGYEIIWRHNTTSQSVYLAEKDGVVYRVLVEDGEIVEEQELHNATENSTSEITTFGDTICFRYKSSESVIEKNYYFRDGCYQELNLDDILALNSVDVEYEFDMVDFDLDSKTHFMTLMLNEDGYEESREEYYNYKALQVKNYGYIVGGAYLFFAYKFYDGSFVKPSKIYSLPVEANQSAESQGLVAKIVSDEEIELYTGIGGCKATFEIILDDKVLENPLIESVVLFSTRDYPLYDFSSFNIDEFKSISEVDGNIVTGSRNQFFSEDSTSALELPFYEVAEVYLTSFEDNSYSLELTFDDYDDIEFNTTYEASFASHSLVSNGEFEYNNRVHKFGITTTLVRGGEGLFFDGGSLIIDGDEYIKGTGSLTPLTISFVIDYDGSQKRVCQTVDVSSYYQSGTSKYYYVLENIISYPDVRAERIEVYYISNSTYRLIYKQDLASSYSANVSYYREMGGERVMSYILIPINTYTIVSSVAEDRVVVETGKMIVSEYGNPYVFDAAHTYYIGDTNNTYINALIATSVDMGEESFGSYPLTIFANDGVYVMEQGSGDILYNSIVKVADDISLSTVKPRSFGGLIFFVCSKGVMTLSGSVVKSISSIIDDRAGAFLDYIEQCEIYYSEYYSEIIIYNNNFDYGYVYSIANQIWYSRYMEGRRVSPTLVASGRGVLDLACREDVEEPLLPSVELASFVLGSGGYTRIEAMTFNIQSRGIVHYKTYIHASSDLKNWKIIAGVENSELIRRTKSSNRYYRLYVEVSNMCDLIQEGETIAPQVTIGDIAVEYFTKFDRTLRGIPDVNS